MARMEMSVAQSGHPSRPAALAGSADTAGTIGVDSAIAPSMSKGKGTP